MGLFGGSFDPPHEGHRHIALEAARRIGLAQVWWCVTPGNPLKAGGCLSPAQRLRAVREATPEPLFVVREDEIRAGLTRTIDAVTLYRRRYRKTGLVLVTGADSLATLHRWKEWEILVRMLPLAVFRRPFHEREALFSVAARRLSRFRTRPGLLAERARHGPLPAWSYVPVRGIAVSSTGIRASRDGGCQRDRNAASPGPALMDRTGEAS